MIVKSMDIRCARVSLREDGIMLMEFRDDMEITLQDRYELLKAGKEISGNVRRNVLILSGDRMTMTAKARKIDLNKRVQEFTLREALVINSLGTRISATFYYKLRNPGYPVKTFKTEEEALTWLTSFNSDINQAANQ